MQQIDFRPDYQRGLKILLKALGVEQPLAASTLAASVGSTTALEGQDKQVVEQAHLPEEEHQKAAEKARLGQEHNRLEQIRLAEERKKPRSKRDWKSNARLQRNRLGC